MATPSHPVSVFQFLDARKFLAAAFEFEKARNPVFSYRYVAMGIGAKSSGFFKDILNGRIRLSPARAMKVARIFKLSKEETDYFETLVLFTQATTAEEKEHYLAKMTGGPLARRHIVLEAFQLEYFKKWHYAAVREMLAIHDFQGDYARLAASLEPPITPEEAMDAVQLLLKLKLIRKNAQGRLKRADKVVSSGTGDPERIKPAIRGNLALAQRALDAYPASIRPFSYLTLSVSETSLVPIREKLGRLRKELLEIVAADQHVDRLYQVNFQMFPLSKPMENVKTVKSLKTGKVS
jgi:uncharacterized protein (TIGR02147 family)